MGRPVYHENGRITNGTDPRAKPLLPQRFVETFCCSRCVRAGQPGILVLKADRTVRQRVYCQVHGADPTLVHYGKIAQDRYDEFMRENRRLERGGAPSRQPALAGVSLRPAFEEEDWL